MAVLRSKKGDDTFYKSAGFEVALTGFYVYVTLGLAAAGSKYSSAKKRESNSCIRVNSSSKYFYAKETERKFTATAASKIRG